MGCSSWGRKESDTTERLHFHFPIDPPISPPERRALNLNVHFKKSSYLLIFIHLLLAVLGLCCREGFSLVAASRGYSAVGGV